MLRRISYDLSRKIKTFCLDIFFNYNRLARHVIIKNKDHSDVDLAICVAADGRVPMILLQCEEIYHAILRYNLRIKFIVSVSTLDDISQLYIHQKKYSFLIPIMIANRPLGRKWQETVNFVRDNISTLSLMINGSDDIASADYIYNGFKQVEVAISDQNFIVMPYYWHAYDSSSKKLYYLSYQPSQKIPLGAGRIFPLRFLEIINWNIFDPFLESQLDNKAYLILSRCSNFSFVNLCQNQGVLLSVKSASSLEMNPLDAILKASTIDYRLLDSSQFKLLSSSFSSSLMRNFLES